MPRCVLRNVLLVMFIASITFSFLESYLVAEPTIDEIQQHWDERQHTMKTFKAIWKAKRFDQKGSLGGDPFGKQQGAALPLADKYTEYDRSILFDQGKIRTVDIGEYLGPRHDGTMGFRSIAITQTWNGRLSNVYYDTPHYPNSCNISRNADTGTIDVQFNWILQACCQSFSGSIDLSKYEIVTNNANLPQTQLVLRKKRLQLVDQAELWCQPRPPYLVERVIIKGAGATQSWTEFTYDKDPIHGWLPHTCRCVYLKDANNEPKCIIDSKIINFETDIEVAIEEFTIDVPAGTQIYDFTEKPTKTYRAGEET